VVATSGGPLYLTRTLERPDGDVGLPFSVCALVEVPAALSLTVLPARVRKRWVILLGMLLFVAYCLLVAASSSMPLLIGAQVVRGVALAVVGALGIPYMQDLLPRATGRATALFANTLTTGSLISGILAGATAQLSATRRHWCCAASSAPSGACCWPAPDSRAGPPTPTWNPRRVRPRPGKERPRPNDRQPGPRSARCVPQVGGGGCGHVGKRLWGRPCSASLSTAGDR
jgi:MFS transporter, SET family, sugar efflux transporter